MRLLTFLLCLCIAVLPACSLMTPQQRDQVRATVQSEYELGNLTAAQRDAALEAIDRDEPFDWSSLGIVGLNLAMVLLGAPVAVRLHRGPPTQRVGLPASKVRQA